MRLYWSAAWAWLLSLSAVPWRGPRYLLWLSSVAQCGCPTSDSAADTLGCVQFQGRNTAEVSAGEDHVRFHTSLEWLVYMLSIYLTKKLANTIPQHGPASQPTNNRGQPHPLTAHQQWVPAPPAPPYHPQEAQPVL